MKRIFILSILSLMCGIKPIPPLGCNYKDAVCVCDEDGDCHWIFLNCD